MSEEMESAISTQLLKTENDGSDKKIDQTEEDTNESNNVNNDDSKEKSSNGNDNGYRDDGGDLEADNAQEDSASIGREDTNESNNANKDNSKENLINGSDIGNKDNDGNINCDDVDDDDDDGNDDDDEGVDASNNARKKGKQTKKKPAKEKEDKEEYMDILGNKTLMKKIVEPGTGNNPQMGERVTIDLQKSMPEMKLDFPAEQLTFTLGDCDVEQALDLSVSLMKLGERATVIAGYKYMYGDEGLPPKIPPFANFKLDVHLLSNHGFPDYSKLELQERIDEAKKKKERGNFYFRRKDFSQAVYVYTKASKIVDPDEGCVYPDAPPERLQELLEFRGVILTNTSIAQLKIGAVDAAIKSATEATKLCPSYSKAYFRLGQAYEQKGLIDEAIKAHKNALKNDPENSKEADSRQVIHNELSRLTKLNKEAKQSQKDMYSKMFWGSKPPDVSKKSLQKDVPSWNCASASNNPYTACFNNSLPKWLDPNIMMNNPMFQAGVMAGKESIASDADLETSLQKASEFVEKMSSGEITNPNELMDMAGRIRSAIPPELDAFMKSQFEMKMQNLTIEEVARTQEQLLNAFPGQLQNMFNKSSKEPIDGMNDQLDQLNGKSLDEYAELPKKQDVVLNLQSDGQATNYKEGTSICQLNTPTQERIKAKDSSNVSCSDTDGTVPRDSVGVQDATEDDIDTSSGQNPEKHSTFSKDIYGEKGSQLGISRQGNNQAQSDIEANEKSVEAEDVSMERTTREQKSPADNKHDVLRTQKRKETGPYSSHIGISLQDDIHSQNMKAPVKLNEAPADPADLTIDQLTTYDLKPEELSLFAGQSSEYKKYDNLKQEIDDEKRYNMASEEFVAASTVENEGYTTTEKKPKELVSLSQDQIDKHCKNGGKMCDYAGITPKCINISTPEKVNKPDCAVAISNTRRFAEWKTKINFESVIAEVHARRASILGFDVNSLRRSISCSKLYKMVPIYDIRKSTSAVNIYYFGNTKSGDQCKKTPAAKSDGMVSQDEDQNIFADERNTTMIQNSSQYALNIVAKSASAESIDLNLKNKANTEALSSIRPELIDEERVWYDSYMGRCPGIDFKPTYYGSKESLDLILMNEENTFALDPIKDEMNEEDKEWYDNFKNGQDAESQQPEDNVNPRFGLDPNLDEYSCRIKCHVVYQDVVKEVQKKMNIFNDEERPESCNLQKESSTSKVNFRSKSKEKIGRKSAKNELTNATCTNSIIDSASTKEVVKSHAFKKSGWYKMIDHGEDQNSQKINKVTLEKNTDFGQDDTPYLNDRRDSVYQENLKFQTNEETGDAESERTKKWQEVVRESIRSDQSEGSDLRDQTSENQSIIMIEEYKRRMKSTYLNVLEEIKRNHSSNETNADHCSTYKENSLAQIKQETSEDNLERTKKWHDVVNEIQGMSGLTDDLVAEGNRLLIERIRAHVMRVDYKERVKKQYFDVLEELKRKHGTNDIIDGHYTYEEMMRTLKREEYDVDGQDRARKWSEVVYEIQRMSGQIYGCNGVDNAEGNHLLDERIKAHILKGENKKRVKERYLDVLEELERKHIKKEIKAANAEVMRDIAREESSQTSENVCFKVYKIIESNEKVASEKRRWEMEFYQREAKQRFNSWESDVDIGYAYECDLENDPEPLGYVDDGNPEKQDEGYSWLKNPLLLGTIGAGVAGAVSFGLYRFYNSH